MTSATEDQTQLDATALCKSCGLCCTGHLFAWAKLRSTELKPAAELGLKVLGSEPGQRGFIQPCPLWEGECTIYTSPHYPHFCRLYKCALLKRFMDGSVSLPEALNVVEKTKERIGELELLLSFGSSNFRERLVFALEHGNLDAARLQKARELLVIYKHQFGVKDLVDHFDEPCDLD